MAAEDEQARQHGPDDEATPVTFARIDRGSRTLMLHGPGRAVYSLALTPEVQAAIMQSPATTAAPSAQRTSTRPDMPSTVAPREIQARVRAGESAEDIATACAIPVQQVHRYEGPVLAEREYLAAQARRTPLGRTPDSPELGELVTDRLASRGVETDTLRWDAYRPGSASWVVTVGFTVHDKEHQARWSFNPQTRVISALEDEARWLSETEIADEPIPRRRLAAVRDTVFDVQATDVLRPGFTRSVLDDVDGTSTTVTHGTPVAEKTTDPGAVGEQRSTSESPADTTTEPEATTALLASLQARRGVRQHIDPPDEEDSGEDRTASKTLSGPEDDGGQQLDLDLDAPASGAHASEEQSASNARVYALPARGQDTEASETPSPSPAIDDAEKSANAPTAAIDPVTEADGTPANNARETSEATEEDERGNLTSSGRSAGRGNRKVRSKVPSWDEIVFGAKSD